MFKIEKNKIQLTRGDTFITMLTLKFKDGTTYAPQEGDTITFALKSSRMLTGKTAFFDKEPLVVKDIPIGTMELQLNPEDTKQLSFGSYKYDIELTRWNGVVQTPIANEDFEICPEVY